MGKWRYEGIDKGGKKLSGELSASSRQEVRQMLRAKNIRVRKIIAPSILDLDLSEWMVDKGLAAPYGARELTSFTKQLSTMLNAGVPIIEALEILHRGQKNLLLQKDVKHIAQSVSKGKSVVEAMESCKGFDRLYCNLVKAGEAGGILDTILTKLAEYMEGQERVKKTVKKAMIYPIAVSCIGILVIWAMMVFVVPQFVDMINDTGQEMPAITQLIIDVSDFLRKYIIITIVGLIVAGFMFSSFIKTEDGKALFDKVVMKTPLIGGVLVKGNLASFTKTLSTMLGAGISLVEALEICIETVSNTVIAEDLDAVRRRVVQGDSLTPPLLEISYFPEMVGQMMKVGEQTGQIDEMLEKISSVFEEEVTELVDSITKLIEPLVIVGLGGIIAVIMVGMYMPIFTSAGGGM